MATPEPISNVTTDLTEESPEKPIVEPAHPNFEPTLQQSPIPIFPKYRRSWKSRLAVLQNFKFFAIFLIPIFLIWLLFIPSVLPKSRDNKGLFILLTTGWYTYFFNINYYYV